MGEKIKKKTLNSKHGKGNVRLYQISVNRESFSFWDQVYPQKTV